MPTAATEKTGDLTFLQIRAVHLPHERDGVDEDFLDLAIFEIEPTLVPMTDLRKSDALDLREYDPRKFALNASAILALIGYPSEVNTADYEGKVIKTRGFTPDGH